MNEISSFEEFGLAPPPVERKAQSELGQADFLKLMTTQFQNQDPFEPMDNGDFLGQLAQFSTVSGIDSLNTSFSGLADSMQDDQVLQAASLVGHTVLAETDVSFLRPGEAMAGAVDLPSSVSNVEIEITNRNGELVHRLELGEQPPGFARFEWDGINAEGEQVPEGHYLVSVQTISGSRFESAEPMLESKIESVTLGQFGQGLTINLPGGDTMPLSQVRRII